MFSRSRILRAGVLTAFACSALPLSAFAGAKIYTNSSHGNSNYGVKRSGTSSPALTTGYAQGNCAHCHEQHASIEGSEPAPVDNAPSPYALFTTNHVDQTDNLCLKCHVGLGSIQSVGSIVNRSYSYRAGGWTSDPLDDIKEAFSSSGSSHGLDNIQTFLSGKWNYNDYSNPCAGCHNPHAAQGDPANSPNSAKSSGSRGWLLSRPSEHGSTPWPLWGDDSSEKMSNYTSSYQAPYRFGSTTAFEPDGSSTENGSNLTDFNTFCTDCHNTNPEQPYSTRLGRDLYQINWSSQDKHGKISADGGIAMLAPYDATMGKVLSCTDCHEPHGSPNKYLIRAEVNGSALSGTIGTGSKDLGLLCRQCHQDDGGSTANYWEQAHHYGADPPYKQQGPCGTCHVGGGGFPIPCIRCHFHGSWVNDPSNSDDITPTNSPYSRTTF